MTTPCGPPYGTYQLVSNPYRASTSGAANAESTMGWRLVQNDQNGRVRTVTSYTGYGIAAAGVPWPFASSGASTSSSGVVTTTYGATSAGATTQVVDEAMVSRTTTVDGLGRAKSVSEDGIGAVTSYAYDALGNLIGVSPVSSLLRSGPTSLL